MNQTSTFKHSEDLKVKLKSNIVSSFPLLLTFLQNNYADESIQKKAIFLGSKLFDILEEEGTFVLPDQYAAEIINEACEIIDYFLETSSEEDRFHGETNQNQIKSQLVSSQSHENSVVFEGKMLCKKYKNFKLNSISLKLRLGEITSLVGENGNGKSTLLRIIAGDLALSSGSLLYPLFSRDELDWSSVKSSIGYVPQKIEPWRNIYSLKDHLRFTAASKGIKGEKNNQAVEYIITRLGLRKYADSVWESLSGGYQLRFELAKQLIYSPSLLVLDEPLGNLDIKTQNSFLNDLRNLANSFKNPVSIILSSQNIYDIESISDQIIFIKNGNDFYNGNSNEISKYTGRHAFLIETQASPKKLLDGLSALISELIDIKHEFNYSIIITTMKISSLDLLTNLSKSGIVIKHFRDISNSTRFFFENEYIDK